MGLRTHIRTIATIIILKGRDMRPLRAAATRDAKASAPLAVQIGTVSYKPDLRLTNGTRIPSRPLRTTINAL